MKFKKLLALAVSAVMLGATSTAAFAAPVATASPKTYEYVALGDSIASGYGLSAGDQALDPALILSEDLIENPVKEAYAAVFGEMLEELGESRGYQTKTTNLSMTAYRAQDVAKTITTPGFKGEVATWIVDTFVGAGTSDYLLNYHDIVSKYLPTADLVSIQLGGNDFIMAVLAPMVFSENPLKKAAAVSVCLVLFGTDMKTAIGGGLQVLSNYKDDITKDSLAQFAQTVGDVIKNFEGYVLNSAENVRTVVDTVKSVNDKAKIAMINMFNPYGNSISYNKQMTDINIVVTSIFQIAAEMYCSVETSDPSVDAVVVDQDELTEELLEAKSDEASEALDELELISALYSKYTSIKNKLLNEIVAPVVNSLKVKADELISVAKDQIGYTIQYLAVGKTMDPYVNLLNEKLAEVAEETDSIYVDVYNISNEHNLDPHPTANGHEEIAAIMWNDLEETITESMVVDELVNNSELKSDRIKVGSSVKVKAYAEGGTGNYQYAFYYRKVKNGSPVRVQDFSTTDYCSVTPAMAAKYEVIVKVRDSAGTVVSKTLPLQVTSK